MYLFQSGRISFIHRGIMEQELHIAVTDGKDISKMKVLHVHAVPLRLEQVGIYKF